MCGRFTQTKSNEELQQKAIDIELPPLFQRRYNVAPSQSVAIIKQQAPDRAEEAAWGLPSVGKILINARSESLHERPAFKHLLKNNRCLIPADGFYEWKDRQPHYFQLPDQPLFAFAGLWRDDRCTIITKAADESMRGIHHRMPVVLMRSEWLKWLTNLSSDPRSIFSILRFPSLTSRPVSTRVNSVAHDDPACLAPAPIQSELF